MVVFISGNSVDAHPGTRVHLGKGWGHTVGVLKPHPQLWGVFRSRPHRHAVEPFGVCVVGGVGLLFEMWIVDASIFR